MAAVMAPAPRVFADTVEACATASEEGQVLRDRGELRAARELLLKCAAEACPGVVRKDCAEWLEAVDRKMPSITPRARDSQGNDQTDVRVLEGGVVLAEKLDGRAIPIDPGPRRLRFERAGSPAVEQTIVVREGEKARPIDVVFAAPAAAPPPPPPDPPGGGGGAGFRIPVGAWVLVGVSAVGAGGLAFFGVRAKNEVDAMRSTCAPNCEGDRVDAARRDSIIANISLGVGAAALAGAIAVVIFDQPKSPPASARKPAARGGSLELRVAPGAAPGVLLRGAF